jgi:hypothetical protein
VRPDGTRGGAHRAGVRAHLAPYLSERQRGTVREDYSDNGEAWGYLPHGHACQRAYRWGEDGLAGFCDVEQQLGAASVESCAQGSCAPRSTAR